MRNLLDATDSFKFHKKFSSASHRVASVEQSGDNRDRIGAARQNAIDVRQPDPADRHDRVTGPLPGLGNSLATNHGGRVRLGPRFKNRPESDVIQIQEVRGRDLIGRVRGQPDQKPGPEAANVLHPKILLAEVNSMRAGKYGHVDPVVDDHLGVGRSVSHNGSGGFQQGTRGRRLVPKLKKADAAVEEGLGQPDGVAETAIGDPIQQGKRDHAVWTSRGSSASRNWVENRAARKSSFSRMRRWSGIVVRTPSIMKVLRARFIR